MTRTSRASWVSAAETKASVAMVAAINDGGGRGSSAFWVHRRLTSLVVSMLTVVLPALLGIPINQLTGRCAI